MNATENNGSNGSNGTTETKATPIAIAHKKWVAAGAKKPDPKSLAAAKNAILVAEKAFQDANAAIEAARDARHKAALAAIELCGSKVQLDLGKGFGLMVPAGQGERVFYRRVGGAETM